MDYSDTEDEKQNVAVLEEVELSTESFSSSDGFGFGLTGNRTMGVYIKIIHGGSPADKDGRLRVGDQLVQINDTELAGLTTEQVARILRFHNGLGKTIKIVIAHTSGSRKSGGSFNMCRPKTANHQSVPENVKASTSMNAIQSVAMIHAPMDHEIKEPKKTKDQNSGSKSISRSRTEDAFDKAPAHVHTNVSPNLSQETAETILSPESDDVFSSSRLPAISSREFDRRSDGSFDSSESENHKPPNLPGAVRNSFVKDNFKSIMVRPKNTSSEELPLVSFEMLEQHFNSALSGRKLDSRTDTESRQSVNSVGSRGMAWHCPVCLDGVTRIRKTQRRLMSTVCGHVFCDACLENVIMKHKLCPTCRSAVLQSEIHPIFM